MKVLFEDDFCWNYEETALPREYHFETKLHPSRLADLQPNLAGTLLNSALGQRFFNWTSTLRVAHNHGIR